MTVIVCNKCQFEKPREEFHKNSAAPNGLRLDCKACRHLDAVRAYAAAPEESKSRAVNWAKAHPERLMATNKRHHRKKKDARNTASREWQKNNKDADASRSAAQRAAAKQATPQWANNKYIRLFYAMARDEQVRTGRKVHVDHIVPLNNRLVCGLHVEDNLQLLFAEDNLAKSNQLNQRNGGGLLL